MQLVRKEHLVEIVGNNMPSKRKEIISAFLPVHIVCVRQQIDVIPLPQFQQTDDFLRRNACQKLVPSPENRFVRQVQTRHFTDSIAENSRSDIAHLGIEKQTLRLMPPYDICDFISANLHESVNAALPIQTNEHTTQIEDDILNVCLLYTSPSPRDGLLSRMPSSA